MEFVQPPDGLASSSTNVNSPYYFDYNINVAAECNGYTSISYGFTLSVMNPCIVVDYNWIVVPATTLQPIMYKINSNELKIENITSWFSVENDLCGSLEILVDVQGGWSGAIKYEQDILTVYTSDLSLAE